MLLGRYPRCDGPWLGEEQSLSRVHALLLLVGERLLVLDLASTNGTRHIGGVDARVLELVGDTELELGTTVFVRWSWAA